MSAVAGAAVQPATPVSPSSNRKASAPEKEKEKRYKCQFCNRAFSRSEHRSRHERSRKFLSHVFSQSVVAGHAELLPRFHATVAKWAGGARHLISYTFSLTIDYIC